MSSNKELEEGLSAARSIIAMKSPFFAIPLFKLEFSENNSVNAPMAVDAYGHIVYNTKLMNKAHRYNGKFKRSDLVRLLMHEILHVVLSHP